MLVITSNNGKLIIQLEWPNNEECDVEEADYSTSDDTQIA